MGEIRKVKGNQIPHGTPLAVMVAAEGQCGKVDCDSWKTVGFDCDMVDDDEDITVRYVICLSHIQEFIEDMFLKGGGMLEEPDDCGDPDCHIHGYLHEDDDDDE